MSKLIRLLFVMAFAISFAITASAQRRNPDGERQQQPTTTANPTPRQPEEQAATRQQGGTPGQAERQPRQAPAPEEKFSVTHHTAHVGGQTFEYTATAGNYIIKDDAGIPKASMFFVAYTKDGVQDPKTRPVAFVFNGGPGSASSFTHMGLGPKHVALTPDGHAQGPAPYAYVDNEDSFFDATDMVFIDAVSTGYSRPMPGENPQQFYGVVNDATWFSDFVYQYLTRTERWLSPKFIIGESYGTTRAAEMAHILQQRHQIYMNGVALLSSVGFGNWGSDDRTEYWLPTIVCSGWFHKVLAPEWQKLTIEQVAQKAREFTHGPYAAALEKGDKISAEEKASIAKELSAMTGLSEKYIQETNLRISPQRWFKELLRDKRLTVGRLDARFTGMDVDAAGERVEYDSSEASYEGAYVAAFQDWVRRELKWNSDAYYTISANVRPWDQGQPGGPAEALRSAMTEQTYLKVLVLCGYYDHATPFNGIENTFDHMNLEPSVKKNVSFEYYEGGHMMYIDKKAADKLHHDVDAWIEAGYKH